MSDNLNDDEYDDDENEGGNDTPLAKDLRRQIKALKKANTDQANELAGFRAEKRKSNVAELLTKAGADAEYAEFYTAEDTSEEAVAAWIQSKSKLLGIKEPEVETEESQQVRLLTDAVHGAPQVKLGSNVDLVDKIRSAKTREELDAALGSAFPRSG